MNKMKQVSHSYGHDNKIAKDSFVFYKPYTPYPIREDDQDVTVHLIPRIKKDPILVRVFLLFSF